jgi:hypothetical protein
MQHSLSRVVVPACFLLKLIERYFFLFLYHFLTIQLSVDIIDDIRLSFRDGLCFFWNIDINRYFFQQKKILKNAGSEYYFLHLPEQFIWRQEKK